MKYETDIFLGILTTTLIYGCVEPPDYPIEPVIEFVEMNRTQVIAQTIPEDANRALDTLIIKFSFTDGDGDLGGGDTSNVFLIDSRLGNAGETYFISAIPQAGATNGISGEITVMIPEIFCFPNSAPRDFMTYSIQIVDKAGHYSNIVQTPPIELICD
ncbi:MAG: hypothetical protein HC803_05735 [Saprospiraceae bacterium]|nr:hypothetical protein [Saprospiraceae bacterium]